MALPSGAVQRITSIVGKGGRHVRRHLLLAKLGLSLSGLLVSITPALASDYFQAPASAAYSITSSGFTAECWVQIRSLPGVFRVVRPDDGSIPRNERDQEVASTCLGKPERIMGGKGVV